MMAQTEPFLRIAACSYEGSLFGWDVIVDKEEDGLEMNLNYAFNCCPSSLRCVAVSKSGKYLACGGMDERIRLYDVLEGRSLGEMSNQSGALTCLQFFGDSYILAGSEDSTVSIWRVHDCVCVHILGGHKAAIHNIAIHPTGKLALTVSKDGYMKMWNLVQGRCAFTRRLKAPADKVLWHSNSLYYLLVMGMNVQVYSASDNSCIFDVKHASRVNQCVFTTVNTQDGQEDIRIATVCENMTMFLHAIDGSMTSQLDVKELGGRPRDLATCVVADIAKSSIKNADMRQIADAMGSCLVIVTSTGVVTVLSSNAIEAGSTVAEAQIVSTKIRIEPRLISVVAWNVLQSPSAATASSSVESEDAELEFFKPENFKGDTGSHPHDEDGDGAGDNSDAASEEEITSPKKKSKKAMKGGDSSRPAPRQEDGKKKKRVQFAEDKTVKAKQDGKLKKKKSILRK